MYTLYACNSTAQLILLCCGLHAYRTYLFLAFFWFVTNYSAVHTSRSLTYYKTTCDNACQTMYHCGGDTQNPTPIGATPSCPTGVTSKLPYLRQSQGKELATVKITTTTTTHDALLSTTSPAPVSFSLPTYVHRQLVSRLASCISPNPPRGGYLPHCATDTTTTAPPTPSHAKEARRGWYSA